MATRAYSTERAALRTLPAGEIAHPFPPIPNLRAWIEARCEQLSEELQRLIGLLDTLDGDCELEEGGDLEPSLAGFGAYADPGHDFEPGEVSP